MHRKGNEDYVHVMTDLRICLPNILYREESGWKLVHADVFRPPTDNPMLLTVFVGTGAQLFFMCLVTIAFAAVGFLSPANRGSLMIAVLLTYVLMGSVAGKCWACLLSLDSSSPHI